MLGAFCVPERASTLPSLKLFLREEVLFKVFIDKFVAFLQMIFYVKSGYIRQKEALQWRGGSSSLCLSEAGLETAGKIQLPCQRASQIS